MGFSFTLTGFPLFVLIISILLGGGGILGSGTAVAFNGQGSTSANSIDCSGFSPQPFPFTNTPCLTSLPANGIIICNNPSNGVCLILINCPPNVPSPLYCTINGFTDMPSQTTVTFNGRLLVSSTSSQVFAFGIVGVAGFVTWIGVAVAIAAVVGLAVFGSGESSEAIHVLMMGALFIGVWLFFSGLEGFLTNSPNSFFVQINNAIANMGTTLYVMLTLVYMLSFVKGISRGGI